MRVRTQTYNKNIQPSRYTNNNKQLQSDIKQKKGARYRSYSQYQQKRNDGNNHKDNNLKRQMMSATANLIEKKNFQHLNQLAQINNECDCGRHLSKFHVVKPNLSKYTIYKKHFKKQNRIHNKIHIAKQYERFNCGPQIQRKTTYCQGFKGKEGDRIEKPFPKDWLAVDGPSQQLTSYQIQYPGHHGQNQYVKPTDRHAISYHPLRCKTTYSCQYKKPEFKKDQYTYIHDHLKTGSDWLGKTTYQTNFAQPDPDYFAKKVKIVQKLQQNPNYIKQFQTVYKNQFKVKNNTVCPAKVYLETQGKDKFVKSKKYLTQNSDFKSFSPQFKAISNSKHYYV